MFSGPSLASLRMSSMTAVQPRFSTSAIVVYKYLALRSFMPPDRFSCRILSKSTQTGESHSITLA